MRVSRMIVSYTQAAMQWIVSFLLLGLLGWLGSYSLAQTTSFLAPDEALIWHQSAENVAKIQAAVVLLNPLSNPTGAWSGELGSGTIVSPEGHILTNYHVVSDDQQTPYQKTHIIITVSKFAAPELRYIAEYVTGDPALDLAILKIISDKDNNPITTPFEFLPIGDYRELFPDEEISIWGYPLVGGESLTVTRGIISGFASEDFKHAGDRWVKTDAAINGGNSGGAAVNLLGHLVGVPTVTFQRRNGGRWEEQNYLRPALLARDLLATIPSVVFIVGDGAAPGQATAPQEQTEPSPPPATSDATAAAPESNAAASDTPQTTETTAEPSAESPTEPTETEDTAQTSSDTTKTAVSPDESSNITAAISQPQVSYETSDPQTSSTPKLTVIDSIGPSNNQEPYLTASDSGHAESTHEETPFQGTASTSDGPTASTSDGPAPNPSGDAPISAASTSDGPSEPTADTDDPDLVRDVATLITRARTGGVIKLAAGTYQLAQPLVLTQPTEIYGTDKDYTFIVSSAEDAVIKVKGGDVTLGHVTLEHTSRTWANVMHVQNAKISIRNTRFTGAVLDNDQKRGGVGLWLEEGVTGTVSESLFENNDAVGLWIEGNAAVGIVGNELRNNKQAGIAYAGKASGIASSNTSKDNGIYGIVVQGEATPQLHSNTLTNNRYAGIAYGGRAGGYAVENTSAHNSRYGIYVVEEARPTLEGNVLRENDEAGLIYLDVAGGRAVGNTSEGNGQHGVYILGPSQPMLEHNILRDNAGYGIFIGANAAPMIGQNTFSGNASGNTLRN